MLLGASGIIAKNDPGKLIIASMGHIAAGKTTVLRQISDHFGEAVAYISEGSIKRSLVGDSYNYQNSLSEDLRNAGYQLAMASLQENIRKHSIVIVDASFHRRFRREWLYQSLQRIGDQNIQLFWLYCKCSSLQEIQKRVRERAESKKCADNQADNMSIYWHIINQMELISKNEFPSDVTTHMIGLDSFQNSIFSFESNGPMNSLSLSVFDFLASDRHLSMAAPVLA